jgi:hypothetical protein
MASSKRLSALFIIVLRIMPYNRNITIVMALLDYGSSC